MPLTAPTEDELAKAVREHQKTAHGMELSEEEAKGQVKKMLEG
jgi:predicted small metal-binding protein